MTPNYCETLLIFKSRDDSLPASNFGTIRYYSRINPSAQMGAITVPCIQDDSTKEYGLQFIQALCADLNSRLPHLYHYFEPS